MHENSRVQLAMVQMPGLNTPQFEWARNKFARAMRPVPPVFEPEVAASAIFRVAQNRCASCGWAAVPSSRLSASSSSPAFLIV